MNDLDHSISDHGKDFINQIPFCCQTFCHLNNKLLEFTMNGVPFDEGTVLDHLNAEQVCYSDPHCAKFFGETQIGCILRIHSSFIVSRYSLVESEIVHLEDKNEFLMPGLIDTHIHASQFPNNGKDSLKMTSHKLEIFLTPYNQNSLNASM